LISFWVPDTVQHMNDDTKTQMEESDLNLEDIINEFNMLRKRYGLSYVPIDERIASHVEAAIKHARRQKKSIQPSNVISLQEYKRKNGV
jgi:ribosomal 50S subunit-associated protein YjgA (DUF615 family)